jgi:hypothetical protein
MQSGPEKSGKITSIFSPGSIVISGSTCRKMSFMAPAIAGSKYIKLFENEPTLGDI